MSVTDIVVIIGAIPLAMLSGLSYWMASNNGLRQHGREALFIWATLGAVTLVVRVLDVAGVINSPWAWHILGVGYLAAFIILCQVQFIINGVRKEG